MHFNKNELIVLEYAVHQLIKEGYHVYHCGPYEPVNLDDLWSKVKLEMLPTGKEIPAIKEEPEDDHRN